jgi:hypothetical protein
MGTAEATGLPSGSVDVVEAAQAFHWFEPEAAGVRPDGPSVPADGRW